MDKMYIAIFKDVCYCKYNELKPATTTHVVNYGNSVIIIKNLPCEECAQCGEKYFTGDIIENLGKIVDEAKKIVQEISVIDYRKSV